MHVNGRKEKKTQLFSNRFFLKCPNYFFLTLIFPKLKEFNISDMAHVVYNPHRSGFTF